MSSRTTSAIIVAVMCGVTNCAQRIPSTPLTGTWSFTVTAGSTTGTPTVTFNQHNKTLTGRYSSTTFGDADLKGTVERELLTFTVFATYESEREDIVFTGEYDGRGAIEGTYSNSFGDGTFAAIRNRNPSPMAEIADSPSAAR